MKSVFENFYLHALLWFLYVVIGNTVDALTIIQDFARNNVVVEPWEVFTWELSSAVMFLSLLPAVLYYEKLFPLNHKKPLHSLIVHIPATLVYTLLHVGGFVAIRKWIYSFADRIYTFGDVPIELFYEYRKDVLTYVFILTVVYFYRELRRLKEGEARVGEDPDEGRGRENHRENNRENGKENNREKDGNERAFTFIATKGNQKAIIAPQEIDFIESAGNYVQIHVGENHYLMRSTMLDVLAQLKGYNFSRIHRAYIVNEDRIVSSSPKGRGGLSIRVRSGRDIECSRRYRQNLQAL